MVSLEQDVEFECQRRAALLISQGDDGLNDCKRFRQKIKEIGLFEQEQIEELHNPTKESLDNKIKFIEGKIYQYAKTHTLNTFVMVFYSGDAKVYDDRRIVIHIPEEKGSSKIVRYKL